MASSASSSDPQPRDPLSSPIQAILFDFGGVLADEGFREGLMAIARANGLPEQEFFQKATERVYETGYVVGKTDEASYWADLRQSTGIDGSDQSLRSEILSRFLLRSWMIEVVKALKARGFIVAVLSDQTQWLDELDLQHGFFQHFDKVFNSYHMGKGKKDPTIFREVVASLNVEPSAALFIDDNPGNVTRAKSEGLHAILYRDKDSFMAELRQYGLP
jgi:putative hydrolase of the HAD superfamily